MTLLGVGMKLATNSIDTTFKQPVKDRGRNTSNSNHAFTLIEMTVVISVIAILLIASVSILGGTGASARKAGSDTLTGMIEQARTTAITSRSYIVLAIAEPGDLPANDNRVRMGLFKVKADQWPDNLTNPVPAVLMSRWKVLENGIVLTGGALDGVPNPLNADELTLTYGTQNRTVKARAIAFNPRGGLHYPVGSTPLVMRIAEGRYVNGVATANQIANSEAVPENRLKIGRVTGRPYRIDE
jgi:prepilin-type N-terminal cleavage/methylation domain-containing protein